MGRLLLSLVMGGALFALVAWQMELVPSFNGAGDAPKVVRPQDDDDEEVKKVDPKKLGDHLLRIRPIQVVMETAPQRVTDPVVVLGHMAVMDKQDVPAQVSGRLLFVGEEVPEGAVQAAGVGAFLAEPFDYTHINQGEREVVKFYRRLYKGEVVHDGQMVAMVDPSRALGEIEMKHNKVLAAKAEHDAAVVTAKEGQNRYETDLRLFAEKVISRQDLNTSLLTKDKLHFDAVSKGEAVKLARVEEHMALILYKQHEIRNKTSVKRSILEVLHKHGGEAVKEQEGLMQLQSLDRLMAEALVEVQFLNRIKAARQVRIEPTQDEGSRKTLHGHRGPINALAVTRDDKEPLILSASEDRTIGVWKKTSIGPERLLPHPEPVRALAYARVGKSDLVLAGCADGSLYLWDLGSGEPKPLHVFKQAHGETITALAFSPDGDYFASGAADGTIKLWSTEKKEARYPFEEAYGVDNPHQDAITALHFTPQSRLVSASRDNTLRVWSLKEKGALLEYDPVAGRTGGVAGLGVSQDGRWMLFDYGKSLQIRSVQDGKLVNTLQNAGGSIPFETLAIFSPDASLLLTAGAAEGRLQLWKAPTAHERGFEVRQLASLERGQVTCAAFSPWAGLPGDNSFAVSGTRDGLVYVWAIPTKEEVEAHPIHNVRLRLVTNTLDPATRQLKIGVEVPNPATAQSPNGRLIPGRPVTIVIE